MNLLDMCENILEHEKKGLHVEEIALKIKSANPGQEIDLEALKSKLSSSLAGSVKRKDSKFRRVTVKGKQKKGFYKLKTARIPAPAPDQFLVSDTGYIGKGGEYAVMSELLLRGFNASLMSVDKGIDIVAEQSGIYFHIQVKTSISNDNNYHFQIKRKAFDANNSGNTFYILVMRSNRNATHFIILPSSQILLFDTTDVIKGVDSLSIKISYDPKTRKYQMNGKQDVTVYANKFDIIR